MTSYVPNGALGQKKYQAASYKREKQSEIDLAHTYINEVTLWSSPESNSVRSVSVQVFSLHIVSSESVPPLLISIIFCLSQILQIFIKYKWVMKTSESEWICNLHRNLKLNLTHQTNPCLTQKN